jgi:Fe-S cluster assembly ATPase SufC
MVKTVGGLGDVAVMTPNGSKKATITKIIFLIAALSNIYQ